MPSYTGVFTSWFNTWVRSRLLWNLDKVGNHKIDGSLLYKLLNAIISCYHLQWYFCHSLIFMWRAPHVKISLHHMHVCLHRGLIFQRKETTTMKNDKITCRQSCKKIISQHHTPMGVCHGWMSEWNASDTRYWNRT